MVGSHCNYTGNTNFSLAVSHLTDSERTKAWKGGTNFLSYLTGKDSKQTRESTGNYVSNPSNDFLKIPPSNSMDDPSIGTSPNSHKATLTEKKMPVLNRADTIVEELMERLNENVLPAEANLLYDLGGHKLYDAPGISSESIIDFGQIPPQTKIMTSTKIVNRPPLLRKGSNGKRGSVYSEGNISDNSDRIHIMLKDPGPVQRRASNFKINNDFTMGIQGIQEVSLNASGVQSDSSDDSDEEDSSSRNEEETPVKKPNQSKVHHSPNVGFAPDGEIGAHTEVTEESEITEKTEQSEHTMQSMKSFQEPRAQSNQEIAHSLPGHYQSPMVIANQESYYEPNQVNPVAANYYDYQYNGGAPGPSQPIEPPELKACDVPQEYYNEVPQDPYEATPAHYTQQQYNSQMVPPVYVNPDYYYYDYVPVAENRSDFETFAYHDSNYQLQSQQLQSQQLQSQQLQSQQLQSQQLQSQQLQSQQLQSQQLQSQQLQSQQLQSQQLQSQQLQSQQLQSHQLQSHQLQNHQLQNHQLQSHQLQSHQLQSQQLQSQQLQSQQLQSQQLQSQQLQSQQLQSQQLQSQQLQSQQLQSQQLQSQQLQSQQLQPEQYYYYHPQGGANNNNNDNFPISNPPVPSYSYSSDNLPSRSYGHLPEGPTQEQAMNNNFDPSNNYSNPKNYYYKPD
jgi:hypothetical protein